MMWQEFEMLSISNGKPGERLIIVEIQCVIFKSDVIVYIIQLGKNKCSQLYRNSLELWDMVA